jgi:hypothetical protein
MSVFAPAKGKNVRSRTAGNRTHGKVLYGGVLVALATAGPLLAQSGSSGSTSGFPVDVESAPRPVAAAVSTTARLVIDGIPDEDAWLEAEVISGFIQAQPRIGWPASERTVVRVLYDDERLYISAVCYDSDMSGLIIPSLEQDYETHDSDTFGFTIDTYLDRRNAFMFIVNPGGAVKDGQVFDNSRNYNIPWEGVMELRTAALDSAWTVEVAIPFSTLRFDPGQEEQSWGFQFSRRIRRKNEDTYWAPLARHELLHKMSRAGTISGFKDLRAGRNLSVKPYASASSASGSLEESGAGDSGVDGGFDLKWGVTPRLTLDGTFRTDFSQVEVDQERVNLTRFSLFFPEKRDFFLENAGTFTLGDVRERNVRMGSSLSEFTLFHSRRIGLDEQGHPIPIVGGGRLTGQAGGWGIGVMDMQTESSGDRPAENFAVARLRRNVGGIGDVGALFINRQATGGSEAFNRSYGADVNLRLLRNLTVNAYAAGTNDTQHGDDWAGRLSLAWRDPLWDASAFVKRVGSDFAPGLGFVRRKGVRQGYATLGAHPTPDLPRVQEINPFGEVSYVTDLGGLLLTREATAGLGVALLDGGSFSLAWVDRFERLDRDFVVQQGAVVPSGDYHFGEWSARYGSSSGRPFSASASITSGGFFNGDRTTLELSGLWRVNEHLALDVFGQTNQVDLPETSFTADVYGGRASYALSTRFFLSTFVQYNAAAEELVNNVRLNFIHAPLSDLFLVYTERRDTAASRVQDRLLSLKVTRLFGF